MFGKRDNDFYWLNCKKSCEITIGSKTNLWIKDFEFDYEKPNKKNY